MNLLSVLCLAAVMNGGALRERIAAMPDGGTLELEPGAVYELDDRTAPRFADHVSNHDQPAEHPVGLPIVNRRGLTIRGRDTVLRCLGPMIAVMIRDSRDITLEGVVIDCAEPTISEARITSITNGHTYAKWEVRGAGCEGADVLLWNRDTRAIVPGTGDREVRDIVERPDGLLDFPFDFGTWGRGGLAGDRITMRSWARPHPAVFVSGSDNIRMSRVFIERSYGMGLLAQNASNLFFVDGGVRPRKDAFTSTLCDATHFSNCRGVVAVNHNRFTGMLDDALNVHATALRIASIDLFRRLVRVRFVHDQSWGFEVFRPGDTARFIYARTLENEAREVTVSDVRRIDDRTLELALDSAVPATIGPGDAVENASAQPVVYFNGNYVGQNRARGVLLTTSGRVEVTDNIFDHVSGSAILLAGDASNWYESGPCRDVTIARNVFRTCNTSPYQFCDGVISIHPSVPEDTATRSPYHTGVIIRDNRFEECPRPYIYRIPSETAP